VAVFRDELVNLLHGDADAKKLSAQTFMFSEFLVKNVPDLKLSSRGQKALVQAHCHHESVMGFQDERTLLARMGLDATIPDSGCCGMAGAFGFEAEHYDISMQCGERSILPEVRRASSDTLIIADGFSCREQITQSTSRQPQHIAEVLRSALKEK
jgi:Fe-S oxidoreductase